MEVLLRRENQGSKLTMLFAKILVSLFYSVPMWADHQDGVYFFFLN